ncbi:DinB family protein [Gordonia sinesedis]
MRTAAYGLTDEQSRAKTTAGELSILGLLTHTAQCVELWIDSVEAAPQTRTPDQVATASARIGLPAGHFSGGELPEMSLDDVLAIYDTVVASIPDRVAAMDLDARVPVPDAPWYPDDLESWNVRWVLNHLITEVARHAGHADIIREGIDGAIAYQLNAQADGQEWA